MPRIAAVFFLLAAPGSVMAACNLPAEHQQALSITACGATTTSSDNKAFIDAALAEAANIYPGIYVPNGVFLTSGNHVPPARVGISGRGTLKLTAAGTKPLIDTANAANVIEGLTLDLSANSMASRVAVDIDGGSSGTVVSGVSVNSGRILAYVTNGGASPTQIDIRNNAITSAKTGGTAGGAIGINSGTNHFLVAGNRINGNWSGKSPQESGGDGSGIDVSSGSSYGEILQNDSYANAGSGIYLLSGSFISVTGNNASSNRQSGIGVNASGKTGPGHLTISANICNENQYDGIDVNEAGPLRYIYIIIQGNYLGSNGPAPGGGGTGIVLAYAANVAIASNTIFNNATAGIWMNSSEGIAVTGNMISGNSRSGPGAYPGILLVNSSHNSFTGNISTNKGGAPTQGFGIEERDSASDSNTFYGNNTEGNVKSGIHLLGPHSAQGGNF